MLFLDEMGEFTPRVLDSLRQPLEEGVIRVARASVRTTLPARFLLVAAMNPCPCGNGGPPGSCRCTDAARQRYRRRLSGPLLDRFDLRVEVTRPDADELLGVAAGEPTATVASRVAAARARARERGVRGNVELRDDMLDRFAPLSPVAVELLQFQLRIGALSGRGLVRVRAVARTIADLQDAGDVIEAEHVSLALTLRAALFSSDHAVAC